MLDLLVKNKNYFYFEQFQQGNAQGVQGAYSESAFEKLDEIFYIVQPNSIF